MDEDESNGRPPGGWQPSNSGDGRSVAHGEDEQPQLGRGRPGGAGQAEQSRAAGGAEPGEPGGLPESKCSGHCQDPGSPPWGGSPQHGASSGSFSSSGRLGSNHCAKPHECRLPQQPSWQGNRGARTQQDARVGGGQRARRCPGTAGQRSSKFLSFGHSSALGRASPKGRIGAGTSGGAHCHGVGGSGELQESFSRGLVQSEEGA
mmetsp:Transcript_34079/g.79176  ORF Transcript_34079/g.79176 Transcript_34079/m.79176 type:complete len:205 (+) Transcript_34079:411-1025(+)